MQNVRSKGLGIAVAIMATAALSACVSGDDPVSVASETSISSTPLTSKNFAKKLPARNQWSIQASNSLNSGPDDPPELPSYEIQGEEYYGGETPPVGFDSATAHDMRDENVPMVQAVSDNYELELVDGSDPRSDHIKQAVKVNDTHITSP